MSAAATLFQRNKDIYVEEENKLESIVADGAFMQTFQAWLDTTISQLDYQYERCEQQLSELQQSVAVQGGSFWGSKTIIDHCNLHMSEKRLSRKGQELDDNHAQLPDLIHLISCLQQTKAHSFMTPKQRRFIEQCEQELKSVVFEPRDLLFITNALQTKLKDDGNARGVFGDLTAFQNTIEDLSPDVEQCEQLLEASIANGEMGLAEDISKRQLEIYEHILRLITDQYPIISNYYSESRNSDRRRRWAIFCMADKDISAVIEGKYRQMEACEEDLVKIREQVENYNEDDTQQRKRYEADRTESDTFLQENKEKQQGVWNRIFAIFQELQGAGNELATMARQRRKEIERRLQMEEREAGRRSGHEAFLHAAAEHAQKLQDTIDNALAAKDIAHALNNFVLDGCDNITAKYDKQQNALSDMLRLVQQHHFKRFSDYFIAASRYLYRKERRLEQVEEEMDSNDMKRELMADTLNPNAKFYAEANSDLALKRRAVAQEILYIRHKLEKAEKAIEPTLRSLDFAGVAYVHPREIVEKMNLNRWSTIVEYRDYMNPSFEKIERTRREEQDELEKMRTTLQAEARRPRLMGTQGVSFALKRGTAATTGGDATSSAGGPKPPQSALAKRVQAVLERQLPGGVATAAALAAAASSASARNGRVAATAPAGGPIASSSSSSPSPALKFNSAATLHHSGAAAAAAEPMSRRTSTATTVVSATSVAGAAANSVSAARPPPARMEGATFKALYSYKARAPDELNFEEGDLIVCVSRAPEEGWFKGICNQRTGLFPINYVETTDE